MEYKQINFDEFTDGMRNAVLSALDAYVAEVTECPKAKGWRDSDLPQLFAEIDSHAKRVAIRFNEIESKESGSDRFTVRLA